MNEIRIKSYVGISKKGVFKDGNKIMSFSDSSLISETLRELYKSEDLKYPKFYKMDNLSKLAYISSEILFKKLNISSDSFLEMSIFMSNSTSSLDSDSTHQKSISSKENYLPSPSVFVYTLANIMMGEIAIRHKIKGENFCLIFNKFDAKFMAEYSDMLFEYYGVNHLLIGWVDVLKNDYNSFLAYISKDMKEKWEFNSENLNRAFNNNLK